MLLSALVREVQPGPLSLRGVMDLFLDTQFLFMKLVCDYLPGEDFSGLTTNQKAEKFLKLFHEKYKFHVYDTDMETLVEGVPVEFMGAEGYIWHDFASYKPAVQLLMCLTFPEWWDGEEDLKTALFDECGKWADLSRIPAEKVTAGCHVGGTRSATLRGWYPGRLDELLKGTKYQGAGEFALWFSGETGLTQMDTGYNEFMECGEAVSWKVVERLASEWPEVEAMNKRMDELQIWMEKDLAKNFAELLDFILKREKEFKKPSKTLMEIFTEEGLIGV